MNKKTYLSKLIKADNNIRRLFDRSENFNVNYNYKNTFLPPTQSSTKKSLTKTKSFINQSRNNNIFHKDFSQSMFTKIPQGIFSSNTNLNILPKDKTFICSRYKKQPTYYPLKSVEKRFTWQNLIDNKNPIHPEDLGKQKKIIKLQKSKSFVGGLGTFLTKRLSIQYNSSLRRAKSACNLEHAKNSFFNRTQRVLFPDINYDKKDFNINKGIKCNFSDSYNEEQHKMLFHSTNGSMKSLFERTPANIIVKSRKRVEDRSFDFRGSLNIFNDQLPNPKQNKGIRVHFQDVVCRDKGRNILNW